MKYQVSHATHYLYNSAVSHCHSKFWLKPKSLAYQKCTDTMYFIDPVPDVLYELQDFYGNTANYFAVQQNHMALSVHVSSMVEVVALKDREVRYDIGTSWEEVGSLLNTFQEELVDVYHFKYESTHVILDPAIVKYAAASFTPGRPLLLAVEEIMFRIFTDFSFVSGYSTIATPLTDIMRDKKGVCQDFAHLAIAMLRSHGLAARYVSGYIETLPPPGMEKLIGADASHAWFSVFVPGFGWYDYDPTNNMIPSDQHVTIAWGRDYADVTPMKGVILSGGRHQLNVSVDIHRM